MAQRSRVGNAKLAAEAWGLIFDFFMLTRPQRDRVLQKLELTPNDVRALATLVDAPEGRTMRSLAEAWSCDASNATWMVDRLEQRGLAQRRGKPGDRRVKLVTLTRTGSKLKGQLMAAMHDPPPELLQLPRAALEALRDAAAQLPRRPQDPLLVEARRPKR